MSSLRIRAFEGWCYFIIITGFAMAILSIPTRALVGNKIRAAELEHQITSHIDKLSTPPTPRDSLKYRSYVQPSPGIDAEAVQSSMIELIRRHKGRLIDLELVETDRVLGNLEASQFDVRVEGDLQSLLDIIDQLGRLETPVLIDAFSLSPVGRFDRPDRRLKLSMEILIWQQGEPS